MNKLKRQANQIGILSFAGYFVAKIRQTSIHSTSLYFIERKCEDIQQVIDFARFEASRVKRFRELSERKKMEHLHYRMSATVNVWFKHIHRYFVSCRSIAHTKKKMSRKVFEPHIHGGRYTTMEMFHSASPIQRIYEMFLLSVTTAKTSLFRIEIRFDFPLIVFLYSGSYKLVNSQ